ncbi:MAG: 4-(cytidine 5'-diphospho)-2-C-methyl-D-erythritol kinase [Candidatus Krumholzibacteriota bacterium]|nr:4-(cytidine 5'-diphospho)-2-C-methyl-D-erythritol kinase [Candidatus Krumholzibacteriota bacterium]
MRAFAPAKLNLGLEILHRRHDGYHEIETLFQALDLGDSLEFHNLPGDIRLQLAIEGLSVPAAPENLVSRAFRLLAARFPGRARGCAVRLVKRIPVGGGLGGGSSDAAAALKALDRLWGLDLEPAEMSELALELGSDVPFFLVGGTAIGRGRGERLLPLPPLRRGAFLLVYPGIQISTKWVYEHLKMGLTRNLYRISVEQVKAYLLRFPASGMVMRNRLEDVVFPSHPVLGEVVAVLERVGAVHVAMTGSGATVFGTFPDRSAADTARSSLGERWQSQVSGPHPGGVELE